MIPSVETLIKYASFVLGGALAATIKILSNNSTNKTCFFIFCEYVLSISTSCLVGSIASFWVQDPVVLSGISGVSALIGHEFIKSTFEKFIDKKLS